MNRLSDWFIRMRLRAAMWLIGKHRLVKNVTFIHGKGLTLPNDGLHGQFQNITFVGCQRCKGSSGQ